MKRTKSLFAILLLTALLLSSCSPAIDDSGAAYLTVEKGLNWKSVYQIGEDLSLDGLTVKYFPDIENDDFETVSLTKDMISGFDTSEEGSFTMTVTYKGKTATVAYTVAPKATPFEIIKSFCIAENTLVSLDSATMKATVFVFDNYFKALENQPTKTEEKNLSYRVNNEGKTCASFDYNGTSYDIFYDSNTAQYHMLSVTNDNNSSSRREQIVQPISLAELQLPQKNAAYKSEIKENIYYSITFDDSYNAVVTKHAVEGDNTVDTVMDSYLATDTVMTVNGLLKYSQSKNGYSASATMNTQGQFKIRKSADNALESIYSVLCSPSE